MSLSIANVAIPQLSLSESNAQRLAAAAAAVAAVNERMAALGSNSAVGAALSTGPNGFADGSLTLAEALASTVGTDEIGHRLKELRHACESAIAGTVQSVGDLIDSGDAHVVASLETALHEAEAIDYAELGEGNRSEATQAIYDALVAAQGTRIAYLASDLARLVQMAAA